MSDRITLSNLEAVVKRINRITGMPLESYTRTGDRFVANIGNYHLSGAYGGYCLHQMDNESGGVRDILRCGYTSKRELYYRLHAFVSGLETQTAAQQLCDAM